MDRHTEGIHRQITSVVGSDS